MQRFVFQKQESEGIPLEKQRTKVRYQTICTRADRQTVVYGLQCMEACRDTWVPVDVIEDISTAPDNVLHMAERFTALELSPLHFRDAVLDQMSAL